MSKSKLISRALALAASTFVGVASYFVISKFAIYLLIDSAEFTTLQVLSYTPIPFFAYVAVQCAAAFIGLIVGLSAFSSFKERLEK